MPKTPIALPELSPKNSYDETELRRFADHLNNLNVLTTLPTDGDYFKVSLRVQPPNITQLEKQLMQFHLGDVSTSMVSTLWQFIAAKREALGLKEENRRKVAITPAEAAEALGK
jgi:hypothetical protein